MIRFKYMGEPVPKGRPRVSRVGKHIHTYTPEKTRRFEAAILSEFKANYREKMPAYPKDVPIRADVIIAASVPKSVSKKKRAQYLSGMIQPNKRPDIDNVLKSIFDALNGYAYEDDAQITFIKAEKIYADEPYVEVTLYPRDWGDAE